MQIIQHFAFCTCVQRARRSPAISKQRVLSLWCSLHWFSLFGCAVSVFFSACVVKSMMFFLIQSVFCLFACVFLSLWGFPATAASCAFPTMHETQQHFPFDLLVTKNGPFFGVFKTSNSFQNFLVALCIPQFSLLQTTRERTGQIRRQKLRAQSKRRWH